MRLGLLLLVLPKKKMFMVRYNEYTTTLSIQRIVAKFVAYLSCKDIDTYLKDHRTILRKVSTTVGLASALKRCY
ncbi:hypothetical protein P029_04600 [Anaplasma phagocytophilum str. Norway variant2]|uniref:Uncharacterized protein n=1 Tax=Anaplasma phagocytophilum str. Norway variant2 TaxID=1392507 RepID=A0A161IH85_ANAPH|nr:hypothetical protein P029_04600 [Anaplasma phagocytophilum str. Norway variant2]